MLNRRTMLAVIAAGLFWAIGDAQAQYYSPNAWKFGVMSDTQ
jgi:hypothetical protein